MCPFQERTSSTPPITPRSPLSRRIPRLKWSGSIVPGPLCSAASSPTRSFPTEHPTNETLLQPAVRPPAAPPEGTRRFHPQRIDGHDGSDDAGDGRRPEQPHVWAAPL